MSLRQTLATDTGVDLNAPLATLHHAHGAIVTQLAELESLPRLVRAAARSRELAQGTLALFEGEVLKHHLEEERELFPAVLRSASAAEAPAVRSMVERLIQEHRWVEQLWDDLRPQLRRAARARDGELDSGKVTQLVRLYQQHAQFEEQRFLPLAQAILGRDPNHLRALGSALHLGRLPEVAGYL